MVAAALVVAALIMAAVFTYHMNYKVNISQITIGHGLPIRDCTRTILD